MKMVKKLLLGLTALVILLLLIALFVSRDYNVQREIVINKPKAEVFAYIRKLRNQDHYNIWVMKDPNMKKTYRGLDGTEGFVYAWDGNDDAGQGEQEIKSITPGEKLDIEIRFIRPMESIAQTPFTTSMVTENQTKVVWGMRGTQPYPLNLMNLFIDPLLGSDMETSLSTLKRIIENKSLTSN